MKKTPRRRTPAKAKLHLVGLAIDNDDGHKRITSAEQFTMLGGSAETHERATETFIKTFETLKIRRKNLQTVEPKELDEIIQKSIPR